MTQQVTYLGQEDVYNKEIYCVTKTKIKFLLKYLCRCSLNILLRDKSEAFGISDISFQYSSAANLVLTRC